MLFNCIQIMILYIGKWYKIPKTNSTNLIMTSRLFALVF